jgi:hypothetical protein
VALEWQKRGWGDFAIEPGGARVEAFAQLQSEIEARGAGGLCLFFDELSLFLGGRDHRELQGDAAFLQFLGGHSRRAPLWVFAALQKTIDDISGLERYSLSQIRDRFVTLPLSLTHLPALVQRRLIEIKDAARVDQICENSFALQAERLPRLDFGPLEWRASFPFYPATLELLEAVTGRFFSRTRSAALFCFEALKDDQAEDFRVPPDAIWDYFAPELEAHPDLRPLEGVGSAWNEQLTSVFAPHDLENGRRAAKWVLLCKIAGLSPTPVQLGNALGFDLDLPGDGAYDYARFLLERLRSRGAFLAIERGESPLFDRYTVDLGRRVGEMARRHIAATLESLPPGDARLSIHALGCCRGEPLPLSELSAPRSFSTFWMGAPRGLSVEVWDGASPQGLANRAAQTRAPGAPDDAILAIWPPFGAEEAPWDATLALLDPEYRAAIWLWKPRPPARDEWEMAREGVAAALALRDPALADNRRGRALLELLQKEAPARDAQLARVSLRLLLEGEIALGGGATLEGAELLRGDSFGALLEAIGDFGWPHLLPRFPKIAPRARILTPSNADSLCLEILRRPADAPFFAPSLERLARHLGEPLGVAKSSAGRWKIAAGQPELAAEMRAFLSEGTTYSALEAHFAKSEWGLRPEQTAITLCALLREGEIAAFDEKNQQLEPWRIGLPLRRAIQRLRPGRLPNAPQWTRIAVLTRELTGIEVGAVSFASAQNAATTLAQWREKTAQNADLARARAAQLRRALNHSPESWADFESASADLGAVLEAIDARDAAFEVLNRAAELPFEKHRDGLARFARFETALEAAAPLLAAHSLLAHPDLVTPPDLSAARDALLLRFGAGEAVLFDGDLPRDAADFAAQYSAAYASWHGAQHEAARWNSWRALAQSDGARALERLSTLVNRRSNTDFGAAIAEELTRRCPRDGALAAGDATCSSCGLRLGERVRLGDVGEVAAALETEIAALRGALNDKSRRDFLTRRQAPFLDWDGEAATLLPLLSTPNLRLLDEAFAPRRRVTRSTETLLEALGSRGTRAEVEAAFAKWLGGGENLGLDDEIEIV